MDRIRIGKVILYYLIGGLFLLWMAHRYVESQSAFDLSSNKAPIAEESVEERIWKARQMKKLNKSYNEMMYLGDSYKEQKDLAKAANRYFDAKTIFPERVEPRLELCRTFYQLSQRQEAFCWFAKKEIKYALKYISPGSHPSYYTELQEMKGEIYASCQNDEDYSFTYIDLE